MTTLSPGKLDLLFRISHFLNLHASGLSLFIIHYQQLLYRTGKLQCFNWHVIACKATMTDEAAGFKDAATLLPTHAAIVQVSKTDLNPRLTYLHGTLQNLPWLPFPICTLNIK